MMEHVCHPWRLNSRTTLGAAGHCLSAQAAAAAEVPILREEQLNAQLQNQGPYTRED